MAWYRTMCPFAYARFAVRMLGARWRTCSRPRSTPRSARPRAGSRRRHIAPHGAAWEEDEEFPIELYEGRGAAGVTGIGYPEALGGQGGDLSHVLVACDELILAGRSVGTVVGLGTHGIALPPIVRFGTPEQQQRFVQPCLADGKIAALAITEPGGGSDVAALATRAERDGDHYVVTGAKTFITSGTRADFVTTRGAHRRRGPRRHLAARDRARHARLHGRRRSSRRPAGGRATPRSSTSTAAACRSRTGSAPSTARSR